MFTIPLKNSRSQKRAFTLTELLVAIGVIGILAAILIPIASSTRVSVRKAESVGNLRSLYGSVLMYAQDNNNLLPFAFTTRRDSQGRTMGTWMNQLYRDGYIETNAATMPEAEILGCPQQRAQFPQYLEARTYGMNQRIGGYPEPHVDVGARTLLEAVNPSKTALLLNGVWNGTAFSANANETSYPSSVKPPFGESVLILFLDGHVSLIEVSKIPTDLTQRDGMDFWRGGVPLE
jgi:prepilin-type N-terminal cleavage/methylation domain-containing protein